MILRKLAIIRCNKVPDSIKPESSKKKLRGRKRRHRKRPINIAQNKPLGRTTFGRCKPATRSFKGKKTICLSKSVRRKDPVPHTGVVKKTSPCAITQTRRHRSCHCSKVI